MIDYDKPLRTKKNQLTAYFVRKDETGDFPFVIQIMDGRQGFIGSFNDKGKYSESKIHKFDLENTPE